MDCLVSTKATNKSYLCLFGKMMRSGKPRVDRHDFSSKSGVRTCSQRVSTIPSQYYWWIRHTDYAVSDSPEHITFQNPQGQEMDKSLSISLRLRVIDPSTPPPSTPALKQSTASSSHLGLSCRVYPSLPTTQPQLLLLILHGHYRHTCARTRTHTQMIAWLQPGTTSWSPSFKVNTR